MSLFISSSNTNTQTNKKQNINKPLFRHTDCPQHRWLCGSVEDQQSCGLRFKSQHMQKENYMWRHLVCIQAPSCIFQILLINGICSRNLHFQYSSYFQYSIQIALCSIYVSIKVLIQMFRIIHVNYTWSIFTLSLLLCIQDMMK